MNEGIPFAEQADTAAQPIVNRLDALSYILAEKDFIVRFCDREDADKWIKRALQQTEDDALKFLKHSYEAVAAHVLGKPPTTTGDERKEKLETWASRAVKARMPKRESEESHDCKALKAAVLEAARLQVASRLVLKSGARISW